LQQSNVKGVVVQSKLVDGVSTADIKSKLAITFADNSELKYEGLLNSSVLFKEIQEHIEQNNVPMKK